jgi:two-component system, NarL family, nitrate/nitrite response regulator NarL
MITVLLVDDHEVLRKIIQTLIEKSDDLKVVATASNGMEAVAQARSGCPNIIVMDISMPEMDGIEATRRILLDCPQARVLMLSTYDTPDRIRGAMEVGANGYVLKDTMADELVDGIRTLFDGEHYFSQKIVETAEQYLPGRK